MAAGKKNERLRGMRKNLKRGKKIGGKLHKNRSKDLKNASFGL